MQTIRGYSMRSNLLLYLLCIKQIIPCFVEIPGLTAVYPGRFATICWVNTKYTATLRVRYDSLCWWIRENCLHSRSELGKISFNTNVAPYYKPTFEYWHEIDLLSISKCCWAVPRNLFWMLSLFFVPAALEYREGLKDVTFFKFSQNWVWLDQIRKSAG